MPITRIFLAAAVVAFATPGLRGGDAIGETRAASVAVASVAAAPSYAQVPPEAWAPQDDADAVYRRGREALIRNDFRRAASLFQDILRRWPRSTYASDAMYWRAFALNRLGGDADLHQARESLATLLKSFPEARTAADARALMASIDGELARRGDEPAARRTTELARGHRGARPGQASAPSGCPDDEESDVRIAALNAVMQMDADRAMPILRQVLARRDACSESLRRKAVWLVSAKGSAEAADLLVGVAKNDPSPAVREQAVMWLGQVKDPRALNFLEEIALRGSDEDLRAKAVWALMAQDSERGHAVVRQLAERADVPSRVREQAVFWLAQRPSAANAQFLRDLFAKAPAGGAGVELKKKILFSLAQMGGQGNDRWLMGLATDASQPLEIRKHALWTAGQAGIKPAELIALYDRMGDAPMKEQLIWVLSQSDDRAAVDKLIDIARRDPSVDLRKKALFWLGAKNDPRVQQLLLDIIDKG